MTVNVKNNGLLPVGKTQQRLTTERTIKTGMIEPGQNESVTLTFTAEDMASFTTIPA